MSERIEDMDITHTLVFDEVPDGQGTPEELPAGAQNGMERKPDSEFDESRLSPEERKMVDDFSAKIDLHNSQAILQYGVGTQKKMADFSESALKNVRTKDLGEVGEMLSSLVTELKSFDVDEEEKGIFKLFKKSSNRITAMKARYDKTEANINQVCQALEKH